MRNSAQDGAGSSRPVDARPVRRRVAVRLWAAGLALACGAVLVLGALLRPAPVGYGTHTQLGFGPCGVLILTGYPCPTCGMTTAFALTARGQWGRAILTQPAGFVFALAALLGVILGVRTAITGHWPRWNWWRIDPYWLAVGLLVLLIGSWAFKIVVGLALGTIPAR